MKTSVHTDSKAVRAFIVEHLRKKARGCGAEAAMSQRRAQGQPTLYSQRMDTERDFLFRLAEELESLSMPDSPSDDSQLTSTENK